MEVTDEMIKAFEGAAARPVGRDSLAGIKAVLEIVERDRPSVGIIARQAYERGQSDERALTALLGPVRPGPCMQSAPGLFEGVPPVTCSLLAGHAGGHTNGVTSWTRDDDAVEPMAPGTPAPMRVCTCRSEFGFMCVLPVGHEGAHRW